MRFKNLNTKQQVSFKKRFKKEKGTFYLSNSIIFLTKRQYFIEYVYFEFIRKLIKKILKYKIFYIKNNFWMHINYNTPITRKSKNARMGKGKGSLKRWGVEVPKNFLIFRFIFYSLLIKKITKKLYKKSNLKLYIFNSNNAR